MAFAFLCFLFYFLDKLIRCVDYEYWRRPNNLRNWNFDQDYFFLLCLKLYFQQGLYKIKTLLPLMEMLCTVYIH